METTGLGPRNEAMDDPTDFSYVTADMPGIGGKLKQRPEDFIVEETPLIQPSGSGEYLYLMVQKRRRLTTDVVRIMGKHFGRPTRAFGYAGLKDKHAITRQMFSIEDGNPDLAVTFEDHHIRILWVGRHDQPLSRGKLVGNRFIIKVRHVEPTAEAAARQILDHLTTSGTASFIGEQRFGYRRDNHVLGRCLILEDWKGFLDRMLGRPLDSETEPNRTARRLYEEGDYAGALEAWPTVHRFERQSLGPLSRGAPPGDAVNGIDEPQRTLLVAAYQSAIFNRVVDRRLRDGKLHSLLAGDVAIKRCTRGIFHVRDLDRELVRCEAKEISASGPLWGSHMMQPTGEARQWELEALHETGLTAESFECDGLYVPRGARRAMRMFIKDSQVDSGTDDAGPFVQVNFELQRGCYATVVMREIMKNDRPLNNALVDSPTLNAAR